MKHLASNIKYLRTQFGLSQKKLGLRVEISPSSIGSYENGRTIPTLKNIQKLATTFHVDIDAMLHVDLSVEKIEVGKEGKSIRILPIVVENDNKEKASIVPAKAVAGYTEGYAEPQFISNLINFDLPFPELQREQTYRVFQIAGESMLPIKDRSYIISSYLQDWNHIAYGKCYIILTQEDGIVFKRIEKSEVENRLKLTSDNPSFHPYEIHMADIKEIWIAKGVIDFDIH
ncbi:helix-turn-helix domain-containing protein [Halosquirtibacter laminarini]|uniref:Helix-turn-helix domain-containing protein n=1 Tax=Halosquirtibacter laminarini TaxID=3374600 RepID=A0AC61NGN5_9BACT|nr:helix-turn-helix domain-containing protein [Prolixibacteraceae bacterium]